MKFGMKVMVAGAAGRSTSFEITIGNDEATKQVLYSKLKSGSFPDPNSVLAAIEKYLSDGSIAPIEQSKDGCIVM